MVYPHDWPAKQHGRRASEEREWVLQALLSLMTVVDEGAELTWETRYFSCEERDRQLVQVTLMVRATPYLREQSRRERERR